MNYLIRKSKIEDYDSIARIVTKCWQNTYRNIVNNDFLDSLSKNEKARAKSQKESFDKNNNHEFVLLINKKIVGFVKVCLSEEKIDDCGEMQAIYILKEYNGYGYGRKLFEKGVNELKSMGCKCMVIGCLDGNPSNEFYKHMGGDYLKQRIFSLPTQDLLENVYYFENI